MSFSQGPEIIFPRRPLSAPTLLRAALQCVAEQGLSGDAFLEAAGISPNVIEQDDALIECGRVADALELAAQLVDMPDLGLRIGRASHPRRFGALGMMVLHASTPADALRDIGRYVHLMNEATAVTVERRVNEYVIRVSCAHMGGMRPVQHTEAVCGALLTLCRVHLGETWAPLHVAMAHRPVAPAAIYQETWGCPVSFEAAGWGFIARIDDLDRALATSNAPARLFSQDMLQHQQQVRLADIVIRAEGVLRSMIPMGYTSIGDLANALGLTERTLQRRLGEQGSSFKLVLLTARRVIVRHNVEKGCAAAAELCHPLGFSESSAVSRFLREHCNDLWPSPDGRGKARTTPPAN